MGVLNEKRCKTPIRNKIKKSDKPTKLIELFVFNCPFIFFGKLFNRFQVLFIVVGNSK